MMRSNFAQRLFVEADIVHIARRNARFVQAIVDGVFRKALVVLAPREALFLRGGANLAIDNQRSRGVVIECGYAKNLGRTRPACAAIGFHCCGLARRIKA